MQTKSWIWGLILLSGCEAATTQGYLETLPVFWRSLYPDGGATLYCNYRFKPYDRKVNVEHVYPMGWVTKELRCGTREQCRRNSSRFNRIESDMHNLYPALKEVNRMRSAYAFEMISGEKSAYQDCDIELDHRRVEPRPAVRGDIARAMLYMSAEHDLKLHDRQRRLMKQWHWDDLPDKREKARNVRIGKVQGNRNSFIDDPGMVSKIR